MMLFSEMDQVLLSPTLAQLISLALTLTFPLQMFYVFLPCKRI